MEEKITNFSKRLPPTKLFLEDIEYINSILEKEAKDITIEINRFVLENISEIKDIKEKTINRLKIASSNPYVSLEIGKKNNYLYISKDTPKSRGIFEKISERIRQKKRRIIQLFTSRISGFIASGFLGMLIILYESSFKKASILIKTLMISGTLLSFFIVMVTMHFSFSKIYLTYGKDHSNYWSRQKDNLTTSIILIITSSLLTLLIQSLLKK